jgi:hypothetical protein
MPTVTFDDPDALFRPRDVAQFRCTTENALAQERWRGTGPPFVRDGRRVLYKASDLADYIAARTVTPARRRALGGGRDGPEKPRGPAEPAGPPQRQNHYPRVLRQIVSANGRTTETKRP